MNDSTGAGKSARIEVIKLNWSSEQRNGLLSVVEASLDFFVSFCSNDKKKKHYQKACY